MLIRLAFLVGILLTLSQAAFACSCTPPPSPAAALKHSTAVFTGKVIAISPTVEYSKKVLFKVDKAWKGVRGPLISVSTSADGASCGNEYLVGEEYLVYAKGTGALSTSLCSRTTTLENAQQDLQILGAGSTPFPVVSLVAFILGVAVVSTLSVLWFKRRSR